MRSKSYAIKMRGKLAVTVLAMALLLSLVIPLAAIPVQAHMPGAAPPPEDVELDSIVISDGEGEIEITIDDVGEYHNDCMKAIKRAKYESDGKSEEWIESKIAEEFEGVTGACPCTTCAFRATLLGIGELWGDEIPQRSDLRIISRLPTPGSTQCFQYITGDDSYKDPNALEVPDVTNPGKFQLILPDGNEIADWSVKALKPLSMDMDIDNWSFIIVRESTGEKFELHVAEDVFPDSDPDAFFELRGIVKFGEPTDEETEEFTGMWEEVRDKFLTEDNWKLFDEVGQPFPAGGVLFGVIVVGFVGYGVYSWRKGKGS